MGFWSNFGNVLIGAPLTTSNIVSPWADPNSLQQAIVGDLLSAAPSEVITPEIALRVPEVNRALQAHQALVSPLKFQVVRDGKVAEQPLWVNNSASGLSTFLRWNGCVKDLYLHGFALLGAELGEDGLPVDMIHIPRSMWDADSDGKVQVKDGVPANYRQRLILIPLGSSGLLFDGIDSIRQARKLELARQARIDSPPAATELHLSDARFDEMTAKEKEALAKSYSDNRRKYATTVTPSYMDVKDHTGANVDLFEAGMNSLRLQLAMHTGVPASFLEAGKEGGSAGAMTYQNINGQQSDLWVFGSARFAYAITARLSMDDVVGPNAHVEANISDFITAPTELTPETPSEAPVE